MDIIDKLRVVGKIEPHTWIIKLLFDRCVETIANYFNLPINEDENVTMTVQEAINLLKEFHESHSDCNRVFLDVFITHTWYYEK
jgi:hypothetical protein